MSKESRVLHGHRFSIRTRSRPEKDAEGRVRQFMPQTRCAKAGAKRLNRHGGGPLCHFLDSNRGHTRVSQDQLR